MNATSPIAATKHQPGGLPGAGLFGVLAPVAVAVKPEIYIEPAALAARIDELQIIFEGDCARLAAAADLLTGEDIADYGRKTAALFVQWGEAGGGPTLPALLSHAMRHFGLAADSVEARAMFMAGLLAEMPNHLQYHGNEHYRKVLFHAIRLTATHNHLFAGTPRAFSREQVAALLTASCIHDMGHEGGDNQKDGVYAPGFMEQRAIDISRPYFTALGFDRERFGDIETMVFCTDITFFAGDNSPCVRLKKIYKHYYWEDDSEDVSTMMMGKLRRFEDNLPLIQMAMILHEADVGSSAGLSYERTIKETVDLMAERGAPKAAGPGTVLAFLREQLGETMFTEAAKQIFGPVLKQVIARAEQDIAAGRRTYYDA